MFSELRDNISTSMAREQAELNKGSGAFELSVPLLSRTFHLRFDTALEACGPLVLAGA